jgi:hypothetical protein
VLVAISRDCPHGLEHACNELRGKVALRRRGSPQKESLFDNGRAVASLSGSRGRPASSSRADVQSLLGLMSAGLIIYLRERVY